MQDTTPPGAPPHIDKTIAAVPEGRTSPLLRVMRARRDRAATAASLREVHTGIVETQHNQQRILAGLTHGPARGPTVPSTRSPFHHALAGRLVTDLSLAGPAPSSQAGPPGSDSFQTDAHQPASFQTDPDHRASSQPASSP